MLLPIKSALPSLAIKDHHFDGFKAFYCTCEMHTDNATSIVSILHDKATYLRPLARLLIRAGSQSLLVASLTRALYRHYVDYQDIYWDVRLLCTLLPSCGPDFVIQGGSPSEILRLATVDER